ncbi:hypothetical protein CRYUN_Cryun20dG0081900 [Craigia yunnanensis]
MKIFLCQSLQKGPVSSSGHNGCTNIPGRGDPSCTSQRTFAGHVMATLMAPPRRPQPDQMVPFIAADNLE